MKRLLLLGLSVCALSATSFANAETVYIPGNTGILDPHLATCGEPILTEGKMIANWSCEINYPISLPVGKTIDSITIAYESILPFALGSPQSIVAYLVENRVDAGTGVVGVGGTNFKQVTVPGPGVISMSPLSVPIVAGNVNWIYVDSAYIAVRYVSITYH